MIKTTYTLSISDSSTVHIWDESGVLQSPGYPADYGVNQRLTWIIHGSPAGSNIRIMDLDLDRDANDHLLIAKGKSS